MTAKPSDFIFFFTILGIVCLDVYGYYRLDDLRFHLIANAAAITMLAFLVYAMSRRLADIPIKVLYLKSSRRR